MKLKIMIFIFLTVIVYFINHVFMKEILKKASGMGQEKSR